MNPSPNSSGQESPINFPILITRQSKKTKNELSISYDTSLIEKKIDKEEEKSNLLKVIKNILLSCNFAYTNYANNKIFGYLKSLFFYNFFYIFGVSYLLRFIYKTKPKKDEPEKEAIPLWKILLLFNIPELLIIFFYRKLSYMKIINSINSLFYYLSERIIYLFNKDTKNNFLLKINKNDYNLLLFQKNVENNSENNLYTNNEEYLSKDTFFDSVIAYPNANFEDFDFNNLEPNEEQMFQDIFSLINEIEKKVKEDHKALGIIGSFIGNLSYSNSAKLNVVHALGFKLGQFLINEIYLNYFAYKTQRNQLIAEKSREFNQKNMANGYFFSLNENVILLFRIKESYKNFDESYSTLYTDSQNLLMHYFGE